MRNVSAGVLALLLTACSCSRSHERDASVDGSRDEMDASTPDAWSTDVGPDAAPDGEALDAPCVAVASRTPCASELVASASPTAIPHVEWTLQADLAQRLGDGSWVWLAGTRDATGATFAEFRILHATPDFGAVEDIGALENVPRARDGARWGATGISGLAVQPCSRRLLVPLGSAGEDLFASFEDDGAARDEVLFADDLSSAAVAYDESRSAFQVLARRVAPSGSCDAPVVPITLEADTLAASRGVESVRSDWPRAVTFWRDGAWHLGGSPACGTGAVTFFVVTPGGSVEATVADGIDESIPWSAQFPPGSRTAVLMAGLARGAGLEMRVAVYDPTTGTALGPTFVVATTEGRPAAGLYLQAEDDSTFGFAYQDTRLDGRLGPAWLVRFRTDGTILQRTQIAAAARVWLVRWTGDAYAIGLTRSADDMEIVRYACPELSP